MTDPTGSAALTRRRRAGPTRALSPAAQVAYGDPVHTPPRVSALCAALVSVSLVAAMSSAPLPRAAAEPTGTAGAVDPAVAPAGLAAGEGHRPRVPLHSSDGIRGPIAPPIPPSLRGRATVDRRAGWRVAPGVRARVWDRRDARGRMRAHLLRVRPSTRGVSLDYGALAGVRQRHTMSRIVAGERAVAGVNGDFFDIGRTEAPLGLGLDRRAGLVHARRLFWNQAFYMRRGRPTIGTLAMTTVIPQRPGIRITNLNSPFVAPGGVGAYTPRWGRMPGYLATRGQRRHVRAVQVRSGRVVRTSRTLPARGRVQGVLLVGRGPGARALGRLRVGQRITLRRRVPHHATVGITGNALLVRNGKVVATDDRELHPRTAIGIDRGTVLLLVVDGRQSSSRGATMVELARMLKRLGAEQALNLDGGGSSAMIARRARGGLRVVNSPSDGRQRTVPNGLVVKYRAR